VLAHNCSLRYENRKLVQGLTRGNGIEGDDITRNVMLMKGAIKMLPANLPDGTPTPALVFVRGEGIVLKTDFATHFKGESNPRNTANGTAKRQSDNSKCAYITIMAYQLLPNGMAMPTKEQELQALQGMGFNVPRFVRCVTQSETEGLYQEYVQTVRASLDYDIDGLVVEVNGRDAREALGELNKRPKGAIAWKFPHEAKKTTLRNIRWQVGNSGRVTPVAEFDTVVLAGANVSQASLHNISNIKSLLADSPLAHMNDLTSGMEILASRRNDVIPFVEAVLAASTEPNPQTLSVPTNCPSCGASLTRDGEYLVCRNDDCPAQATGAIKRWVKKIGVLHVGDTLIEAMVEDGMVADPADLYTLDPDAVAALEIGGRKVGGTASKAVNNLNAKKSLPLHVLVGSLGIPLIGREMAKMIVDAGYNTLSLMLKARVHVPLGLADGTKLPAIASIPGVGDTKAVAFVEGFAAKTGLIAKLLGNGVQVQTISGPLVGQSFCMTGFRDQALSDAIEKAGGTMKSSVSKGLTYLIAQDPSSTSGKAQKARQYGTKVIGIEDARKLAGL